MPNWTPAQECAMQLEGRDILVSAAAGSGKTATLTERIIRSLTEVDGNGRPRGDISRMLIVTFTRAAAAELRARISKALSEAIAEQPDNRYLYRQLLALGSADICTIDAFYQKPVRAHFERLGLPSSFRLADDAELMPLKEQVLDRLIEQHYQNAATASHDDNAPLSALAGNAFALAMDDLLPNRDKGDTAALLLGLFEKLIAFPESISLLRQHAERLEREAALPFIESTEGKILTETLCAELESDRRILQRACDKLITDAQTANKYLPAFAHDLDTVKQLLADLQAARWDLACEHARAYVPLRLGALKGAADIPFDVETFKSQRSEITKQLRSLTERYFTHTEDELRAQMLHTARTQHMLYALLSDYDSAIREQKNRRDVLDFSDVRRYLLELLLDEDGRPTDVARSLSDSYDAVYIDEYQDVDTVQDAIFSLVGAGGKRFMVGDIKQSIYSFRSAEPSIFAAYRKRFPTVSSTEDAALSKDGNCVFMSNNFRCDGPVIHFTNLVCGYAFRGCPDTLGYEPEDDLICSKKPPREDYTPTSVKVVLLETPPRDEHVDDPDPQTALNPEAVWVADEIARLLREEKNAENKPLRAGDVAILMRSLTSAGEVVKALHAHGIQTSYAARDNLASHPDMIMMVNLLSVIDNPRDDVPLMGLLCAQGSPITLADILAARGKDGARSLYDDLCTACDDLHMEWSEDTRRAVRAFLSHLERWRALAASLPIDRLLRKLYAEPFLAPLASTPALLALYDRARQYQNASFCGLYQFLTYLRRLLADPKAMSAEGLQSSEDAVHIMTIHKSKGLEFPVVFVCGCASSFNDQDTRAPIMFDHTLGAAARMYESSTSALLETVTRSAIASRISEKQTEEEMRILYVALTRARERLYVTARLRSQAQKSIDKANRPTAGDRHAILSADCYLDWILAALSPDNHEGDLSDVEVLTFNRENFRHPHPKAPARLTERAVEQAVSDDEQFYRGILERHRDYVDPRAALRQLPTKAAASKLRSAMLDGSYLAHDFGGESDGLRTRADIADNEGELAYIRRRIELMQAAQRPFDELLRSSGRATAAERGTATHLFLQHCDFKRLAQNGIAAEIERLRTDGFLSERAAELLYKDQLERFCNSELFRLATAEGSRIWRELRFDRFVPYSHLTRDAALAEQLEGYSLYVQGSIDLLIEDAQGSLWLCDYKTDRIRATSEDGIREQLLSDHADQLGIYADAVKGLFSRRPDHVLIYSLPLGQSVELTPYIERR